MQTSIPRGSRYNQAVTLARQLPDRERLSTLMAVILLAYAIARFVQVPGTTLALELAGIYLPLRFDIGTMITVLVAALTATGTDWLLRDHPKLVGGRRFGHWLLPAMTAWVLSLPLGNLPYSPLWWAAFAGSAVLLVAVLIAEYVSVDPANTFYRPAALVLGALAYGLFLILAISLRGLAVRLILILPTIALAAFLIGARVHLLRSKRRWQAGQSLAIAFLCAQLAGVLHYFPISAVSYGLALLGLLYALTSYAGALSEGAQSRRAAREALVSLALFLLLALAANWL